MPPHIIKDLPPTKKKRTPKNWHPWSKEVRRRERIERMKFIADNLGVINAVIASEDEEERLDY
jgi:ribosomal protein S6E (S10)